MKRQQATLAIPAVLSAFLCFSVPSQAKLGETVPQLIKRFGKNYTIQSEAVGETYKFDSETFRVDVLVSNGVSIAETYFSDHPLTASGEPPNDIVQPILKTNVPRTRWVKIEATPFSADYALQSSNREYIAFLRYKAPQPEGMVWTMTVGDAKVLSSNSFSTSAHPSPVPVDTPTPTPEASPTGTPVVMDCPPDADESAKSDTLHFKGFYLGMPLGCAAKLIDEKYGAVFGKIKIEDSNAQSALGMSNRDFMALMELSGARKTKQKVAYLLIAKGGSLLPAPVIEADAQQRVIAFHFSNVIVDGLFNSSDMKPQDFAQEFANSYNIPKMDYFMRERPLEAGYYDQGWEYTSPKGFYVKIDENKGLVVEAVPASGERKFD